MREACKQGTFVPGLQGFQLASLLSHLSDCCKMATQLLFLVLLAVLRLQSVDAVAALPLSQWVGKRVMMIAAHPDDIEGCAAGTIAQLTKQGTEVFHVILTNG